MAKKRKIGAIIALDGEKEFKSAVTACNKSLGTMKSEMKLVSAQTEGNANSLEALSKKHDVLQKILDEQIRKEDEVRKGLDHAEQDYKKVGSELEQYKNKLSEAQETLKKMESSQDTSKESTEEQRKVVEELSTTVENGEKTYQRAESRVLDWKKSLNTAEAQTITATRALNENTTYMKEAENSADGCATSIDAFGKQINAAADATDNLNTSVNKIFVTEKISEYADVLSGKMRDLAGSAYDAALELDEGYDTIITKTGATGEALDSLTETADNIFGDMPTQMSDVGVAVGEVNTRFGQTGKALEETSKQFMQFAEINGTDLNESIDATDRIMEQFGFTAEQTGGFLGLLTKRGQETGKSVSDLMAELDGNAATFKELEMDVAESANLLAVFETNGVDAGTALRGLKTAVNNYAKEGLSARQGLEKTISKIKNATSSTEALALAQETFGTKGAQVMADGIRDGRINLDDLSESMDDYKGTVKDTFESTLDPWDKATVAANNLKTAGAGMVSEFLEVATPAIDMATDAVKEASKKFKELPEPAKKVASVLGAVGAAAGVAGPQVVKVYSAIKTLKTATEAGRAIQTFTTAQTAMATATEAATVAQSGLNLAMLANPATLVVGGLVALTAAVAIFAGDSETARDAAFELADAADEVNESAGKAAESLNEATAGIEEAMSGNSASEATAYKLIDELEELQNKTKLTTAEQGRMKTVIGELNTMFPDMGLEIDSVTGKLSMGSEEIKEYVKNSLEMAKIEAVQKAVKETTEKLVDAEIKQTEAQQQLNETTKAIEDIQKKRREAEQAVIDKNNELKETQEAYNEALITGQGNIDELTVKIMDQSEAQIEYNGTMMSVSEAYRVMAEDEELLTQKKAEQQEAQEALNDSVASAQEQINTYTGYLEANTQAADANTEAEERKQEASAASIETAGQELEAYSALSQQQQEMAVSVTNTVLTMQESVQSALQSQMNMFEEFNAGTEVTKEEILANMQSQVDGVLAWEQNMNTLMTEAKTTSDGTQVAISEGLMQYLASMGPEGSTYMQQFVNMSGDELAKANELWEQSVDIKNMSNQWGTELTQAVGELAAGGEKDWEDLAESLGLKANESGEYVVQGLISGMQSAQELAKQEGEDLGIKTVDAVDTGAGVASPSTKTKQTGVYVVEGLVNGIQLLIPRAESEASTLGEGVVKAIRTSVSQGNGTVSSAVQSMGVSMIQTLQQFVNTDEAYNIGINLAYGLANGIYGGRSSVINAVQDMCASAVNQARSSLDIHSPSRVFAEIGALTAQGFSDGYGKKAAEVKKTVQKSISSMAKAASNAAAYSKARKALNGTTSTGKSGSSGNYPDKIVIEIPIYVAEGITKTAVEEVALSAITKKQTRRYVAKGVRVRAKA